MAWLEITVNTAADTVEDVAAQLTARGFSDLVIEDQEEFETFLEENRTYWDYIDEDFQQKLVGLSRVTLYLQDSDRDGMSRLEAVLSQLGLAMQINVLQDTNWEESWKDSYPPLEVGQRLVVLPYWLEDTATEREKIILDPGLTFGTGAHPSTQMVMEVMERSVKPGARCLDLGSGSGILSITALRLGAANAVGVDIDPKAEDIARVNAAYNGFFPPVFQAYTGNVTEDKTLMNTLAGQVWDLLLVNIVADVIIGLAPVLPGFMGKGTTLICSGILDSRLKDVTAALERAGLEVTGVREKEEWRCVTAKR